MLNAILKFIYIIDIYFLLIYLIFLIHCHNINILLETEILLPFFADTLWRVELKPGLLNTKINCSLDHKEKSCSNN